MKLFHRLSVSKRPCKGNLEWRGSTLYCPACGQVAGFRWIYDGQVNVYLYPEFKDVQTEIESREDTYQISGASDVFGEVSFKEFDEFIADVHRMNTESTINSEEDSCDPQDEPVYYDCDQEVITE